MSNIICMGIIVADLLVKPIDNYPVPGSLKIVEKVQWTTGGCAVNVAVALKKLSKDTTLIGKVGKDMAGDFILNQCQHLGIRVDQINKSDMMTSTTVACISSNGERSFIHYPGANQSFKMEDINLSIFHSAEYFYIGGLYGLGSFDHQLEKLIMRAKAVNPNLKIILDVIYRQEVKDSTQLDPILPLIDLFTPNYKEAENITGQEKLQDIAAYFHQRGLKNLIVTRGEKGAFFSNENKQFNFNAYPVEAVDTTGAGDAFVAGVIAGLSNNYSYEDSLKIGSAVGAMSVSAMGASPGIKSFEETLQFIKKFEN